MNWDSLYMNMAYLVAMKSKDQSTHIGAVIVGPDNEVRSTGYNSFVRGIDDNVLSRHERPEKYFWFEHAERNAIYNAALMGLSTKDCRMYTNGIPCMDCARGVIQSGIKEVIVDSDWDDGNNGGKWVDQAKRTMIMFHEFGITVRRIDVELIKIEKYRRNETF